MPAVNATGTSSEAMNTEAGYEALAGAWEATGLLSSGAHSSLLADTQITAEFDLKGRVSGTAGCNRYTAGVSTDGTSIQISAAAATRMFRAAPEGVMEQEAAYLSLLSQAASFGIQEAVLDLYGADGALLVSYERVAP